VQHGAVEIFERDGSRATGCDRGEERQEACGGNF